MEIETKIKIFEDGELELKNLEKRINEFLKPENHRYLVDIKYQRSLDDDLSVIVIYQEYKDIQSYPRFGYFPEKYSDEK